MYVCMYVYRNVYKIYKNIYIQTQNIKIYRNACRKIFI